MQNDKIDTFVITLDNAAIANLISGSQLKIKLGSEENQIKVILKPAPYGQ